MVPARQDQLEFAAFLRPGPQERMAGQMRGGIGRPSRAGTDPVPFGKDRRVPPQDGRRMQEMEVYIAGSGQRLEHLHIHRVRRGEPVHEEPLRQGHIDHAAADRVQGRGDQFRQAGRPYPCPDQPPQARLPDVCFGKGASIGPDVLSVHPGPDHLRPAPGVAGEQSGDLAGRSQPLAVAQRIDGIRGVDEAGQKPHPRLAEVIVHHRDHGAGQSGSLPGIQRRSQFGNRSEHLPDEAARGGKLDVGAHPVAGRPVSQFGGDPLGEPALDTARRYGHHLLSEGIGRRQGQLLAQPAHQLVGM